MSLFFRSKRKRPTTFTPTDSGRLAALGGDVEARAQELGRSILAEARGNKSGLLSRAFWSDKLMDWSMKDEAFKVQLFRFVDAYPMLTTPEAVHDHLVDYLTQPGVTPPPGLGIGLKAGGVAKGMLARTMSGQITGMAEKFIAGTDAESAVPKLRKLWDRGMAFSVDLLGEACISDKEADEYQAKYLDLVDNLPKWVNDWPANPILESDHLGTVPRINVSIKVSSLSARTDPIAFEKTIAASMERIIPILTAAASKGVFINFDMESFATKDLTLELFRRCCEAVDFDAGLAMQAYLRSGDEDARRMIEWAKRTGKQVTVRLVKGAYWDYETIYSEQQGWPVPVWSRKSDTDACFERMAAAFIEATPTTANQGGIKLALGSHNVRSIAVALAELEKRGLPQNAIELQMLHGMADPLKEAAADRGLRLREYVPVGEMVPGMAYLVRRLLENTSNESWLKAGFLEDASPEELLRSPHTSGARTVEATADGAGGNGSLHPGPSFQERLERAKRHRLSNAVVGLGDPIFFTEPMRDFSEAGARQAFAAAVGRARLEPVANDGTVDQANRMLDAATAAFARWRDTEPLERSRCLTRAAEIMRRRRDEIAAICLRENGKDWRNADADVCEAIDFCEYYARMAVPLFQPKRLGRFVGELDETWYQPRGVAAVISPWNFPIAIACGMVTAALVTGNTVILKPAEQTPYIAKVLCEILWEAGVPRDVLHYIAAPGETVGAHLVRDPRVAVIAFTGSKAVGLDIVQAAGVTHESQWHVKKVISEMGGKNAIIIDASADLDEAVVGVRDSAFGFQGQKCSACSRVVVVQSAHDAFLHRLVEATRSLVIGDPADPSTDVGPVIDEAAAANIRRYIEIGKQEAKLELGMHAPAGLAERVGKPYVGPHIFSGVRPEHRIAQEEIFGPVLSVMKVPDFEAALKVANHHPYKLTGGVYSRKPSHLERARREFRVGNLYLNRGITGALVGRQPFGGFGMSGVGSKAGGADYLLQFVEPRACAENTMRRGFAPGLFDAGSPSQMQSATAETAGGF